MNVHHMSGLIILHGDLIFEFWINLEMVEGVLGREVGGGQVKKSVGDKNMEGRIEGHSLPEGLSDVDVLIRKLIKIPCFIEVGEDLIWQIVFECQIPPDVIIKDGSEGTLDGAVAGIKLRFFPRCITVETFKPGIEPAYCPALIAEELFCKAVNVDP